MTERGSYEEVLQRAGTGIEVMRGIKQRQIDFFGHVMSLQQLLHASVTLKNAGRRCRRKLRIKLINSLADVNGRRFTPVRLSRRSKDDLTANQLSVT